LGGYYANWPVFVCDLDHAVQIAIKLRWCMSRKINPAGGDLRAELVYCARWGTHRRVGQNVEKTRLLVAHGFATQGRINVGMPDVGAFLADLGQLMTLKAIDRLLPHSLQHRVRALPSTVPPASTLMVAG
jgi:hypothetical protein